MSGFSRRGACPSLSAPMQTGDGLLARLSPADGELSAAQLAGVARAAQRYGNGLLEITARGNLQIRGLTRANVEVLGEDIAALGIKVRTGVTVETGPLAGLDALERADPRPLAEAVREGARPLAGRLAPKVSVIVDGGGALPLGGVLADVRLAATSDGWRVAIGGDERTARRLGVFDADGAVAAALALLDALALNGTSARARDLTDGELGRFGLTVRPEQVSADPRSALPVGRFALRDGLSAPGFALPVGRFALRDGLSAPGFALPFGQIGSDALAVFADAAREAKAIRLARGRGLLVIGLPAAHEAAMAEAAARLGFVAAPGDPRLSIVTCAGAPACRSAKLATKAIAAAIARDHASSPGTGVNLHISGCPKKCSAPSTTVPTLVGTDEGCIIEHADSLEPGLRSALGRLGRLHSLHRKTA